MPKIGLLLGTYNLSFVKIIIHNSKVILIGTREVSMELLSTLRRFTKVDVFVKAPRATTVPLFEVSCYYYTK